MSALPDELRALGREQDWPATPDVASAVAPRLRPRRAPAWRPALVVPALVAVLVAGVAVVPPARTAVLDVLGLAGGTEVVRVPTTPRPPPHRPTAAVVGRRVTLAQAQAAVRFRIRIPRALGAPAQVRLARDVPGGAVSLGYGERAVLTMFAGRTLPYARKIVGPRTKVVRTTVAGRPALFLSGAPSQWIALGRDGLPVPASARLIDANVLLFDAGGVGYRLETRAGLHRSLLIARSLAP